LQIPSIHNTNISAFIIPHKQVTTFKFLQKNTNLIPIKKHCKSEEIKQKIKFSNLPRNINISRIFSSDSRRYLKPTSSLVADIHIWV
jgi:hypothetical protein